MVAQPFAVQRRDFLGRDTEIWFLRAEANDQGQATLTTGFARGRPCDTVEVMPLNAVAAAVNLYWVGYATRGQDAPVVSVFASTATGNNNGEWLVIIRRRPGPG